MTTRSDTAVRKKADSPRRSSTRRRVIRGAIYFGLLMGLAETSRPDVVTLNPVKDNTLYESESGSLSNGAGDHLFAGLTGQSPDVSARRALLAFDLTGFIQPGSRVFSVELILNPSRTIAGSENVKLHRVLADWGEGTSHATGEEGGGAPAEDGDATWIHRVFDSNDPQLWSNEGGDFDPTPRAVRSVGGDLAPVVWGPNAAMTADVQDWVDNPGSNFGWMVIGNEPLTGGGFTVKRFDSRENPTPANRPQLVIDFDLPGAPTRTPTPTPTATATPTTTPTPQPAPDPIGKSWSSTLTVGMLSVAALILIRRRSSSAPGGREDHS